MLIYCYAMRNNNINSHVLRRGCMPFCLRAPRLHSTQYALEHCLHTLVSLRGARVCGLLVPGYVTEATEEQKDCEPPLVWSSFNDKLLKNITRPLGTCATVVVVLLCFHEYNFTVIASLANHHKIATWLILPVVIRSSQRLSHACLSINTLLWNCERLIISVLVYSIVSYYLDIRSNSRANTCINTRPLEGWYLLDWNQPVSAV